MKTKFSSGMFTEETGRKIFAVNANKYNMYEAHDIATSTFGSSAKYTEEYLYVYFGFGQVGGKQRNCYWVTDKWEDNRVPVYCFVKE